MAFIDIILNAPKLLVLLGVWGVIYWLVSLMGNDKTGTDDTPTIVASVIVVILIFVLGL